MDLIRLYSATQSVVQSLETSGLMPALKSYRAALRNSSGDAHDKLMRAAKTYIESASEYEDDEQVVVNLLHLGQIGTLSFWMDMTSDAHTLESRQSRAVSAFSKIMFAANHLPSLLALVREGDAINALNVEDSDLAVLVLRLYDAVEPASDPDRVSRLIDAVDLIYRSTESIVPDALDLQLVSISGVALRSVVFHGDADVIAATKQVIQHLNQAANQALEDQQFSVESIASEQPFLGALEELMRVGTIEPAIYEEARRDALEGSIMLMEAGGHLVDYTADKSDMAPIPASVIARLDIDAETFAAIDERILGSIESRYEDLYDQERAKLTEGGQVGNAVGHNNGTHQDSSDEDLTRDLNSFYGQPRQ